MNATTSRKTQSAVLCIRSNVQRSVAVPRRSRARFTLQIRDHAVGDSLTLNLHPAPWRNQWLCEAGQFSSAHLGRALALILQGGA